VTARLTPVTERRGFGAWARSIGRHLLEGLILIGLTSHPVFGLDHELFRRPDYQPWPGPGVVPPAAEPDLLPPSRRVG
jgi:hypothetical protein